MMCPLILSFCILGLPMFESDEATPVEFTVHSGYFERNDSGLTGASSFLVIEDRTSFDKLFAVAFTMGPRPNVLPDDAFATKAVVAVIKRGGESWEYTVQGVTEQDCVLTVRYTATSEDGHGARFASPLIVSVPKGTFRQVVFTEGGKEVGKAGRNHPGDEARMLFDFTKPEAAQAWQPVNDGVMGGVSDGRFKITDQGTMEFFGILSLENNGGFASVRSRRTDLGLKTDDTLLIRLKGDGREYLLNLYVPALQIAYSYRAAIPTKAGEWTEVKIPLKDCYATSFGNKVPNAGPVDAAKVNSLGFMLADKKAGPFKLEIAWVKVVSQASRDEAVAGGDEGKSTPADKEIGPEQMMRMAKEAAALADAQVEELRDRLKGDPKDLEARLLLIFRGLAARNQAASPANVDLLLGLIENHPKNPLSSELPRMLGTPPEFDQAAKKWLEVVKEHENDATVLGNAGSFLTGTILNTTYRDQGEALLRKARSLEPEAARWALALGSLYEMDMVRFGPVPDPGKKTAARNALEQFEAGLTLVPEAERAKLRPEGRHIYQHIAVTALACDDLAKAGVNAEKMLAFVTPEQDSWNYGNAVYDAHTILGRVALSKNDVAGAERHLLESGRTPGSPQLNSFGPNMVLADQLLERGSSKAVLEFLDLCGKFWSLGKDRLAQWSQAIQDGKEPDFGGQSRQ
jgi:hypothetical protein